ncbi:MAG: ABC transporter substrate-binding protein [Clostridiales bacterium]|nr:ABC transporter substrate-binding protein [Clostridiales bacterium]
MKKLTAILLALVLLLTLSSCSKPDEAAKITKIGIIQFAEHGSLDNCRQGFIEGLAAEGFVEGQNVTFVTQNSQADFAIASQIASSLVDVDKCDMICAIATPAAQAAFNYAQDKNIPVIFTAVTDPVGASLAAAEGENPGQITGTSDLLAVEAQLKMIRAMMPEAKKIGILYNTSESNNELPLSMYNDLAATYGFEIVASGITAGADIPLALDALLPQVDCISNLTDNTVVSYLAVVLEKATAAGKPVFGSEIEQVKLGCVAAEGLEYLELGRQTGRMAAKVLKGEAEAKNLPFELITNSYLYVNKDAMASFGIELPADMADRAIDVLAQ